MVASISTWRLAELSTRSRNSRTLACWLCVARTLMLPVSGLAITEAASRNTLRAAVGVTLVVAAGAGVVEAIAAVPEVAAAIAAAVASGELAGTVAAGATGRVATGAGVLAAATLDPPSGTILSVSRSRSIRLALRVSQNRLDDVLSMDVVEVLPPPTELLEPIADLDSRWMLG